jgi:hypothetical protein
LGGILGRCGGRKGECCGEDEGQMGALDHRSQFTPLWGFASLKERNGVCGFAGGGRILE